VTKKLNGFAGSLGLASDTGVSAAKARFAEKIDAHKNITFEFI
jgi:hypothetical protein